MIFVFAYKFHQAQGLKSDFGMGKCRCYLEELYILIAMLIFRQLRNLEKAFGGDVRVCDRTALILDIFDQRAATREAALQAI